jgi:flagellar motor switch protein FliN/FliY
MIGQANAAKHSQRNFMTESIYCAKSRHPATPEPAPNAVSQDSGNWGMDSLLNVELPINISFGSLEMPLEDVLKLDAGSIIELDKSVNDPVTIIVNHRPIAKGEMIAIGGNCGVRILEVESTADRIRSLS